MPVEDTASKFSNSRSKKVATRFRTGSAGCRQGPRSVACEPARTEVGTPRLHRRDRWRRPTWRVATAAVRAASASFAACRGDIVENDDFRCRAARRRDCCTLRARRTNGWGKLSRLCRAVRLVPILRPGDIVVMDNLASHTRRRHPRNDRSRRRRTALPAALPAPTSIPSNSSSPNSKPCCRKAAARTVDALIDAIADALTTVTSARNVANYLANRGYRQRILEKALIPANFAGNQIGGKTLCFPGDNGDPKNT